MDKEKIYTEYNKKTVYDEQLAPLVAQMRRICKLNKIPFFISTAIANSQNDTVYCNDGVLPGSNFVKLHDDNMRKYLLVSRGAEVSVQRNIEDEIGEYITKSIEDELDMDDEDE